MPIRDQCASSGFCGVGDSHGGFGQSSRRCAEVWPGSPCNMYLEVSEPTLECTSWLKKRAASWFSFRLRTDSSSAMIGHSAVGSLAESICGPGQRQRFWLGRTA